MKDRILGKSTLALVAHLPAGNIPQPAASVSVTSKIQHTSDEMLLPKPKALDAKTDSVFTHS
jgi:hypothetical protein